MPKTRGRQLSLGFEIFRIAQLEPEIQAVKVRHTPFTGNLHEGWRNHILS